MAAKTHRGKTIVKIPKHGRGTCPICNATGIKLLYEVIAKDSSKVNVCKRCKNKKLS